MGAIQGPSMERHSDLSAGDFPAHGRGLASVRTDSCVSPLIGRLAGANFLLVAVLFLAPSLATAQELRQYLTST